jgi:hypothetical protein
MSFVLNGGKFKLYTVLNDLIFPTPTQPRISFERAAKELFWVATKQEKTFSRNILLLLGSRFYPFKKRTNLTDRLMFIF